MNCPERLLYLELFIYCWGEGTLPADEETLISISGFERKSFRKYWPKVSEQFQLIDNKYHHRKIDDPLRGRRRLLSWQDGREKGAKSTNDARAKAKAIPNAIPDAIADAIATLERTPSSSSSTSSSPASSTPPPGSAVRKQCVDPVLFQRVTEEIWQTHPADVRGTLQECRQYAAGVLVDVADQTRSVELARDNHRKWLAIYTAKNYNHSLENWWAKGKWEIDPGEPPAPKQFNRYDPMAEVRKLAEAKKL